MKRWSVFVLVPATLLVEVEAETEEEALRKGLEPSSYLSSEIEVGEPYEATQAIAIRDVRKEKK